MANIERWKMTLTPCGDLARDGFDWCGPLESCCMRDRAKVQEVEVVPASALEGAVEERDRLRRLVLRDHAQGHKAHADCPACQKFGVKPNGSGGR